MSVPAIDAFDQSNFDPALRALLEIWRRREGAAIVQPDHAVLSLLRDDMPEELKAFLVTVAYRGGRYFVALPSSLPAANWWLDRQYLEVPDRDDPSIKEGLDALGAESLLQIGCDPGGHINLYAAWSSGKTALWLEAWDSEFGEKYTVGAVTDLLLQALAADVDNGAIALDDFAKAWIQLARQHGAALDEPPEPAAQVEAPTALNDLNLAAASGDVEACRRLLDQGANVDKLSADGNTPLVDAIVAGKPGYSQVVDLLLERGGDPNIACRNETAGFFAINFRQDADLLAKLLQHGLEVNRKGQLGRTLLSWAAGNGDLPCIETLVQHGADLNARDNETHRPVVHAISAKKESAARLLLELGADATTLEEGWGPIFQAAYDGQLGIVELLLAKGADPHVSGNSGKTAAQWAKQQGHAAVVERCGAG